MMDDTMPMTDPLVKVLAHAFAPLHKRALGIAVGVTVALVLFLVTSFHVAVQPRNAPPLQLLAEYFYGYDVTWGGALIGSWWGFVVGFVTGWFVAFVRNFALATWIFVMRTRAELAQTRDFLDHI